MSVDDRNPALTGLACGSLMTMSDLPARRLVSGFLAGWVIVFVVVLLVCLALDVDGAVAVIVAVVSGLIVGGSVGFLVAGRGATPTGR